jgi:hypothetical protein
MFTAQQYRAKADEYGTLLEKARSPAEAAEYRDLQQSYTSLADNLDWLTVNAGKTVSSHTGGGADSADADRRAEENILRCLGTAVILNWNTIPAKLQRSLFNDASSIQNERGAPLKGVLAQFLHDHKDDAPRKRPN